MSENENWISVGNTDELIEDLSAQNFLKEIEINGKKLVLSYFEGQFGALNARCNHMGGPLAKGKIKKGCIECPWHYWQFDHKTGEARHKSFEPLANSGGKVSSYPLKIENGNLYIDLSKETERVRPNYNPALLVAREPKREIGKIRVLALSTTAMDKERPRYSTSEDLLKSAINQAGNHLDVETKFLALSDLHFKACEGFYSRSERACTWPCSITKMDPEDEMVKVYEALVHWADVVIVGTPIRWGTASSLYHKMVERMNSVQNQITINNRVLIKNKVVGFIITGGQDNIQAVAGQMLTFFGELGYVSPPFPFVAHSLGWSSEKMEQNMDAVRNSEYLREQSFGLVQRAVDLSKKLLTSSEVI